MLTVCVSFVHQPFGNHFGKQPKIGMLFISACTCYGYVYQQKSTNLEALSLQLWTCQMLEEMEAVRIFELEHLVAIPSNVFIYMIF